jgi:hypothetical protein
MRYKDRNPELMLLLADKETVKDGWVVLLSEAVVFFSKCYSSGKIPYI